MPVDPNATCWMSAGPQLHSLVMAEQSHPFQRGQFHHLLGLAWAAQANDLGPVSQDAADWHVKSEIHRWVS